VGSNPTLSAKHSLFSGTYLEFFSNAHENAHDRSPVKRGWHRSRVNAWWVNLAQIGAGLVFDALDGH
jgi:hypothetical protein